jgi:hypothetical protein
MNVTVLELLREKLPEKYVLAIIANMEEKNMLDEDASGTTILDQLDEIFDWQESNEGWMFWLDVFEALSNGDELPKLPLTVKWLPNSYVSTPEGCFIININGIGKDILLDQDFTKKSKDKSVNFIREKHFAFCN